MSLNDTRAKCGSCSKRKTALRTNSLPPTGEQMFQLQIDGEVVSTHDSAVDAAVHATGHPGAVVVYLG